MGFGEKFKSIDMVIIRKSGLAVLVEDRYSELHDRVPRLDIELGG